MQYSVYGRCPEKQVHTGVAQRDMSDGLLTPLNTEIASGVRVLDVELAVVNGEPSESVTSRIRVISEPCKERFLFVLLAIALVVPDASIVATSAMTSPVAGFVTASRLGESGIHSPPT